MATQWLGLGLG